MNRKCCVKFCDSKKDTSVLHSFPIVLNKRYIWINNIDSDLYTLRGRDIMNLKVCEKHFENKYKRNSNRLSTNAIPTLYLPNKVIINDVQSRTRPYEALQDHNYDKPVLAVKTKVLPVQYIEEETIVKVNKSLDLPSLSHNKAKTLTPVVQTGLILLKDTKSGAKEEEVPVSSVSGPFSWQKNETVSVYADDADLTNDLEEYATSDRENINLYSNEYMLNKGLENINGQCEVDEQTHRHYQCNGCRAHIIGYTCLQCVDYDLCRNCEARDEHCSHYMLRVPGPRPHGEVQKVLKRIRKVLISQTVPDIHLEDEVKMEVKEEIELLDNEDEMSQESNIILHESAPILYKQEDKSRKREQLKTFLEETWLDEDILEDLKPEVRKEDTKNIEDNEHSGDYNNTSEHSVYYMDNNQGKMLTLSIPDIGDVTLNPSARDALSTEKNVPKTYLISNDSLLQLNS